MNEQSTSTNILGVAGGTFGVTPNAQRNGGKESSLGDKFQFSQVLGATVDSPEKTYADAQKPKDPADTNQVAKPSSSDDDGFNHKYDADIAPSENREANFGSSPKEDGGDKIAENSSSQDQAGRSEGNNQPASSNDQKQSNFTNEGDNTALFVAEIPRDEVDQSQQAAVTPVPPLTPPEKPQTTTKAPRAVAAEKIAEIAAKTTGNAPETKGQVTSKAAHEVLSSALRDTTISKVGEDLHKAVFKNTKEVVIEQKAPSIGNSLANKQERDLSQRLKNNAFSPVKVSVDNSAAKLNAVPAHTKAPIAQLAEISLEETQSSLSPAAAAKLAAGGDAKAANSHNIGSDAKVAAQSQAENSLNVNQMLRQQAAATGAQQAAANQAANAPKAPIAADIPNINAVAGPNGSNQSPRVAKVVAPPPPPPPKPPAPVEQIAVQIKKAIGEGADKINIKLNPAHLGKVEVKMDIARDGQLTATVIAERPETLELLQRDVRGLEKALQEGGLKTDLQSFNFSLKEQAQQQAATGRDPANGQQNQQDQNKNGAADENAHSIASEASLYGQNVATNGGVDIRI